ncbi:MAG: PD40 domain-containing protein [Anaerolineales bacterium]|nr:PD40 domain-containing protein [Anaerolineales bacterium]
MNNKTKIRLVITAAFALVTISGCAQDQCGDGICQPREISRGNCPADCEKITSKTIENITIKTITENGGNVDWHHKSNKIAIGKLGDDGYFDVWLINPDGSNEKCLTCYHEDLPNKHIGNAAWHPSGEYLVIQVEKSTVPNYYDNKATPGAGMLNDLYFITKNGKKVWELYRVNDAISKDSSGILHPHFSHNGKKLAWAERIKDNDRQFGEWAIKIADFKFTDNIPILANIETLQPGSISSFYETHTFSPDDSKLLFTGNQDGSLEIYELDVETKKVKRLTNNPTGWDEHATYSPDGTKIIWMSSKDVLFSMSPFYLQTEFWLMDADGNNKRRLTYFHEKGHLHYFKAAENDIAVAADNSWGPNGDQLIALVITADPESNDRDKGRIVIIEFDFSE